MGPDHTYEGWCRIWNYNEHKIILESATRDDGTDVGAVVVADPRTVERPTSNDRIDDVKMDAIEPSPYCSREFEAEALEKFAREMRHRGRIPASNPIVRENGDTFELISGHRRVAAARRVAWDTITVRIVDIDDWAATRWFVGEHVPLPSERPRSDMAIEHDAAPDVTKQENNGGDTTDDDDEWYSGVEIETLVEQLRSDWSDDKLRDLPQIVPYLEA